MFVELDVNVNTRNIGGWLVTLNGLGQEFAAFWFFDFPDGGGRRGDDGVG